MNPLIDKRLAEIEVLDRRQCLEVWITMTGARPTARLSLRFLRKALAFEIQCKELGGHSAAVRRKLRAERRKETTKSTGLTSGTHLFREWNGRIYRVTVVDDGFELDGQRYTSLSAVARRITGAEWSGPRFFGLRKRKAS